MTKDQELMKPDKPPVFEQLKLVTMTIDAKVMCNFNLNVIAEALKIDNDILGIKYRDIVKGISKKDKRPFKNQCTFVIKTTDKNINTKLFNNGKIVNVGCTKEEHGTITGDIILKIIQGLSAVVTYTIPEMIFDEKKVKKFFKDEVVKRFSTLYQLIIHHYDLDIDFDIFNPELSTDDKYTLFINNYKHNDDYTQKIMYIHQVINILKSYYNEDELENHYNDSMFQYFLTLIGEGTNFENGTIECELPSYIDNHKLLSIDPSSVQIVLINQSTNSGYFIDRDELINIMSDEMNKPRSLVKYCTYNKDNYPGVIIEYLAFEKVIKIIVFNTGKINITAARTLQQVEAGFQFIKSICFDYFDRLLLSSEYDNRQKEYEHQLPNQHYVKEVDGQSYFMLRKQAIVSHPRNVRLLHQLKLLKKYIDL